MKKKYILFDFDGTIMDTNEVILDAWQASCRKFLGHEVEEEVITQSFGEVLKYTISYLIPDADVDEVVNYYRAWQESHCEGLVHPFPGIMELLEDLKARGYKMAVATSRTRHSTLEYMKPFGMAEYFDAIVTVEDVTRHKPDPETIDVSMAKLGATAEESIMVGDTRFDIGCADNAGVESVFVTWSRAETEEALRDAGYEPTYVIKRPEEMTALI